MEELEERISTLEKIKKEAYKKSASSEKFREILENFRSAYFHLTALYGKGFTLNPDLSMREDYIPHEQYLF
jgi:hypothetical protein